MEYKIIQNIEENRFEAVFENQIIGVVDFLLEKGSINVTHTGVLPEYEGNGIAASLNKDLLEYALNKNLKVIPSCSYTNIYIERHPKYKLLLI